MKTLLLRWIESGRKHWRVDAAGLGAVVGLTAIAYLTQIQPAIDERVAAASAVVQIATQRQHAVQLNTTLHTMREQTAAARRPPSGTLPLFEPEAHFNERLARLSDLAAENGVQVDGIEPHG